MSGYLSFRGTGILCCGFLFLWTPCCLLPSFIFNYFYIYNIPCLLVYLKILALSQPMNFRRWHRNAEVSVCFVTALIQSRSKSWIYVLASKINSLSSILRVLFSSSIDFLSYFHILVIYYIPKSPTKGWKSVYPQLYKTHRLKRQGGKNKLENWKKIRKICCLVALNPYTYYFPLLLIWLSLVLSVRLFFFIFSVCCVYLLTPPKIMQIIFCQCFSKET